jgi:hypothetical protein
MTINASDVLGPVLVVTKDWTKQRKAEERRSRSRHSRTYVYSSRVNCTDVMDEILPSAYDHASGNGRYPVSQRQLYYACREEFKRHTRRTLDAKYFASTLLRQYLNRNSAQTESWKITADPRGTLTIPNAGYDVRVPCGTLAIESHLHKAAAEIDAANINTQIATEWPSLKHGERYQGVIYIEKEGFEPLLKDAKIAQRFDVAILSCKGQSVVAARAFVDEVCRQDGGVPLLVVHDFDKAGFEISQSLTRVSRWAEANDRVAYHFKNKINVIDLGLRLTDVEQYGLASETVTFKGKFAKDSICTEDEKQFLRSNQRVELNAFTSPQFIEWLEGKLRTNGLHERLIPNDSVLVTAYRRAFAVAKLNHELEDLFDDAIADAGGVRLPDDLHNMIREEMELSSVSWDEALYAIAQRYLEEGNYE